LAFASIALSTRLQPGLEQKIVLPRNSYLQDYFDDLAEYMKVGPPLYFVMKNFNYRYVYVKVVLTNFSKRSQVTCKYIFIYIVAPIL